MEKYYELKYHELEPNYWFFSSRRDLIRRLVLTELRTTKVLEVGCASGALMRELGDLGYGQVSGIDISAQAIEACLAQGLSNTLLADAGKTLPFLDGQFDLLISSDVLEHIENDTVALKEWARVLRKGGKMILLVPAFMFLWSEHDVINSHFRRYGRTFLVNSIKKTGFKIDRVSYWNFTLFLPISFIRLCLRFYLKVFGATKKHVPSSNLYGIPNPLNQFLKLLIRCENYLISKGVNFPFGVSLLVCAVKE